MGFMLYFIVGHSQKSKSEVTVMQIKTVPISRGLDWITEGFGLFRLNPLIWLGHFTGGGRRVGSECPGRL